MPNKKFILFFIFILSLCKLSKEEKKILIIEGDYLDKAITNSILSNYKLFLLFHVKNCPYCTHALKVLKNDVIKHYKEEENIFFGSIDLDQQSNLWLGLRFNITKIPFIILIENKKMYHFESQFEESVVLKFINEEKNIEDGEDIPEPVTFRKKFDIAVQELTEKIQIILNKYFKNNFWNKTMTYILLFTFFICFIYLESTMIEKCRKGVKNFFNRNDKKNNEKEVLEKKNNEKENKKDKKDKKD